MNKRIFIMLLCLLCYTKASSQPVSIGKKYYASLNKGLEAYFLHHDFKLATKYFDEAFKVKEPDIYSVFRIADIFFKEKQYEKFLKLREKGILLGDHMGYDLSKLDSAHKVLIAVPYYKIFQQKKDSLYTVFKANLDLNFTELIYMLLGTDQFPRGSNEYLHKGIVKDTKLFNQLLNYADSINYFNLKDYITKHGAPKMNRIEYQAMSNLNLFYMHIRPDVDSAWGNGFLTRLFKEQYELGNLPNTFIPVKMDRDIGGWDGNEQVFGFFQRMNSAGEMTYDAIQNLATVDSLRTAYDLPVLAVDAQLNNLKLPEGYKLNDRYTVLRR
jgi:hypothetical protein